MDMKYVFGMFLSAGLAFVLLVICFATDGTELSWVGDTVRALSIGVASAHIGLWAMEAF